MLKTPHPNAVFLSKGSPMAVQSPSRRSFDRNADGFLGVGSGHGRYGTHERCERYGR